MYVNTFIYLFLRILMLCVKKEKTFFDGLSSSAEIDDIVYLLQTTDDQVEWIEWILVFAFFPLSFQE